jgi:hypothetical protein
VVTESPFQQFRGGVLEKSIDWALGLQGRVSEVSIELNMKGKKAGTVVLKAPAGNLSLSIGLVSDSGSSVTPLPRNNCGGSGNIVVA